MQTFYFSFCIFSMLADCIVNQLCFVGSQWIHLYRTGICGYGYLHGYPRKICGWIWMGNFISTATLGIILRWYHDLSKFSNYICEHWRLLVDSLYQKIIDIDQYLLNLFENTVRVRFFEPQCIKWTSNRKRRAVTVTVSKQVS